MRTRLLLATLAAALIPGCSDPCQEASDRITAAYEACGITVSEEEEEAAAEECTEAKGEQSQCTADCVEDADCAAFDGSDLDASQAYSNCVLGCL